MKCRRNYYRILQVQPDAPLEIIRASYRALMKELGHHPDLGGGHLDAQNLNEAYETLIDPELRARYDIKLFKYYTKEPIPVQSDQIPLIRVFCPFCKRPLARKADPDETCYTCSCPLESRQGDELEDRCKRSVQRMRKSGTIRFYDHWPQKGEVAQIRDISPIGICLICPRPLQLDGLIKLSGPLLKAIARVVECRPHRVSLYSIGFEFKTVTFAASSGSFVSASA